MALFNNLAQVQIVTSKTILDIYHNKLAKRIASRVAEPGLKKLGNIRKMSNLGGDTALSPVFLTEIKLWQ